MLKGDGLGNLLVAQISRIGRSSLLILFLLNARFALCCQTILLRVQLNITNRTLATAMMLEAFAAKAPITFYALANFFHI
jgi:hypothetical protein